MILDTGRAPQLESATALAISAAMSRETLAIFERQLETFLARHAEVEGERAQLASRLATVERAYDELLRRVQKYEGERVEIRGRVERLLARLASPGSRDG